MPLYSTTTHKREETSAQATKSSYSKHLGRARLQNDCGLLKRPASFLREGLTRHFSYGFKSDGFKILLSTSDMLEPPLGASCFQAQSAW